MPHFQNKNQSTNEALTKCCTSGYECFVYIYIYLLIPLHILYKGSHKSRNAFCHMWCLLWIYVSSGCVEMFFGCVPQFDTSFFSPCPLPSRVFAFCQAAFVNKILFLMTYLVKQRLDNLKTKTLTGKRTRHTNKGEVCIRAGIQWLELNMVCFHCHRQTYSQY